MFYCVYTKYSYLVYSEQTGRRKIELTLGKQTQEIQSISQKLMYLMTAVY